MHLLDNHGDVLPADADTATLVGRVFDPDVDGPCVVVVRKGRVRDVTSTFPTMTDLLEFADPAGRVAGEEGTRSWDLDEVLRNSLDERGAGVRLLAPVDLSVLKAAGVTFASSLMERLIEERAGGDKHAASAFRTDLEQLVGADLATVRPGSADADALKAELSAKGLWSQYLEVGLGPDPEVFTKAPVLSAVGCGQAIGVASVSSWNNPEPEVAILVTSTGEVVGATLGNDVNLRDVEGRSALLLPKAKDNNASAAVGPFIRLFDDGFSVDDVRAADVRLEVLGEDDGFILDGVSSMPLISRDPKALARYTVGESHQYPDGILLYLGTLFTPSVDRDGADMGFTHHLRDIVRISSPRLGTLVNRVTTSEAAPPWTFGIRDLIRNLSERGLTASVGAR
ncbi:fumarylacetoacetate hydrolase family protein [Arthrobacter sedimenti]|uniref:fumarylacetoacetate hydrolase family protein n=1 Tax=Arthrobacter sedimenti TaxID=2694931 RepID=UPI000B34B8E5|nr:fumarylacetoacetate hydrolase [Arthrobacter sedimenti]OUM43269.1 fumarylacetoacetate hydrolase [Arthrobacter agilis]